MLDHRRRRRRCQVSMICTDEEEKQKKEPFEVMWVDEASAKQMKAKVVVAELLGSRRQVRDPL
jgi:hypothetical protein